MGKKYYWLKLKDDFFRDKKIKKLRRIAGGDTYTIIYLKMQLLSLSNDGVLVFEGVEDSFAEEIALEIDEDVENVKVTIAFLMGNGLLEETEQDHYVMIETLKCIGKERESAERVRKHRKIQQERRKALQCNGEVTNCNTEIDIEKEKREELEKKEEIEIREDIYSPAEAEHHTIPYKEIIDYLNFITNSSYRSTTNKTRDLIKARYNEGFILDDFKIVIEKKYQEWANTDYSKYLRPETLFGTKFESYLNQPTRIATTKDLAENMDFSEFR
jgi:uncharacterized phage protein (TIGR02220 family)/predicted phage replisome organizer